MLFISHIKSTFKVHKHISSFGGDPDHLVIMGQSAGGVCAHLQMMSPLARDKLRAAITISGGAYNFWGMNFSNILR